MEVVFKDSKLGRIEQDDAAQTGLPISVIMSCRRKLILLRSAPDERTLRNWKSLHYEKLKGDRESQRSIRLNDQWRLVFELDDSAMPPKIFVLEVEDYH
jgi:toxin HigB-1